MSQHEKTLIEEIDQASSVFTEELSLQVRGEATFKESCNLPALYIKKIIRFCKNIPAFRLLHKEDQLLIIKPFFTEMLLIRFAFAYNYEHDAISVIEVRDLSTGQCGLSKGVKPLKVTTNGHGD